MNIKTEIENENLFLGIELGSTTIKAVLNNQHNQPIEEGTYSWVSHYEMEFGHTA